MGDAPTHDITLEYGPLAAVALLDMFDIATDIDTLLAELDRVEPATDVTPPHEQPSRT